MPFTYITVPSISPTLDFTDPLGYSGSLFAPSLLDLMTQPCHSHLVVRPRREASADKSSKSSADPNKFQVMLNVKHFKPEELSVKTVENFIVVHGKHEENVDEHGLVSREFTRRYAIPDDVEPQKINSSLSQDGILTIQAPRKTPKLPNNERVIPITMQKSVAEDQMEKLSGDAGKQEQQAEKTEEAEKK